MGWGRSFVLRHPATGLLGALTLGMFAVQLAIGGTTDLATAIRLGAMRADRVVDHFEIWRLVLPMFLHFGAIHLALNGLAFVQLASMVEELWGGRRLIVFYVASGVVASACSAAFNPGYMGAVGASGAIMGLAGAVLGTSAYGPDAIRELLADLRPRLRRGVLFTLILGGGLWLSGLVPVDNAAHIGGLLTGFALAAAYPADLPSRFGRSPGDERSTFGALVAGAVVIASIAMAAWKGGDAVETLDADTARLMAEQASRAPGTYGTMGVLVEMLDHYDEAGQSDEGVEVFRRAIAKYDQPVYVEGIAATLLGQIEDDGLDRDLAAQAALERWLELEPSKPDALNALAWLLVIARDPAHRDPVRAESLARDALSRVTDPTSTAGKTARASYLDTLAEALFQQGKIAEAGQTEREAVGLATELKLSVLPDLTARLEKIEAVGP